MNQASRRTSCLVLIVLVVLGTPLTSSVTFFRPGWNKVEEIQEQVTTRGFIDEASLEELKSMVEDQSLREDVRGHAIRTLGHLGRAFDNQDIETYLKGLATGHEDDLGFGLRDLAKLEYWKMVVDRTEDSDAVSELLQDLTKPQVQGHYSPAVNGWAAHQVCAEGNFDESIEQALRRGFGIHEGQKEAKACALKARVVREHGSQQAAYEAALTLQDPSLYRSLHTWAIDGLADLETEAADQILLEFVLRTQDSKDPQEQQDVRLAIHTLRKDGWSVTRLKDVGVEEVPVFYHD